MLQTLSVDIRECYLLAEQCRRLAETALTPSAKTDFVDMERRWLSLAHNYEYLQNGYRISPHRSASAIRRKNKPPGGLDYEPQMRRQLRGRSRRARSSGRRCR
jgi:hypothetical protein